MCGISRGPNSNSVAAAALFIRFLREQGVLPPPARPAVPSRSLAGHRGVSFLDASAPRTDGDDPGRLSGDHRGAARRPWRRPADLHRRGPAQLSSWSVRACTGI